MNGTSTEVQKILEQAFLDICKLGHIEDGFRGYENRWTMQSGQQVQISFGYQKGSEPPAEVIRCPQEDQQLDA